MLRLSCMYCHYELLVENEVRGKDSAQVGLTRDASLEWDKP